jgi:hypothetical protein
VIADWSVEPEPAPPAAAEPVATERSPIEALEILEALFLEQPALTKALLDELNRADTGPLATRFGSPSAPGVAPLLVFGHSSALSSVIAARHNDRRGGQARRYRSPDDLAHGFGSRAFVASKRPQDSSSSGGLIHDWPQA